MAGTVKVYYCKQTETPTEDHRLIPAPTISVNPEIYYSNDSIIGYSYSVSLNGYAVAKESNNTLLEGSLDQVEFVRSVFNVNGGNLYVKDQDDNDLIVCKGSTIRGINFAESPNYGLNYIPYSIDIEFNEVDFPGCNSNSGVDCSSSLFHLNQISQNITTDNLVDIKEYKIREFSDGWSFTIDNEIYQQYINPGQQNTENNIFRVQYQLQATGKHYYVNDTLVPAWHQARAFVQDRLYKQVKGLITGIETLEPGDYRNGCNATRTANELYEVSKGSGLLEDFVTIPDVVNGVGSLNTEIYDETISCQTSESDGTFSVTYSAIIKRGSSIFPEYNMANHTFSVSNNYSNDNAGNKEISISVNGTIQGYIRGGYIYNNSKFDLPQNGTFIVNVNGNEDRYFNARNYYYNNIGGNLDLSTGLKNLIGIDTNSLIVPGTYSGNIQPETFVLDHNYSDGTIGYNATYTTGHAKFSMNGFTSISVVRKDPTPKIQEFMIPGRSSGPIIQDLGMSSPRTISINIEGFRRDPDCMPSDACNYEQLLPLGINNLVNQENSGWIMSKKNYNTSVVDGSFSISLEFTCIS